ncbi:outer membrane beta-barrel protein [Arenicella xantha]|uniref:Outer membrane protein beta-barrel domain-containing protein n=1 Tax=Arenicella xantha TaxID=644221 RepID=A0A395JQH1_9GAMM|nr:outer membrane beta-barrel protein [Arenicella xantha]RBP50970.1 hypothetical protein DFR28_102387 [Arenicella xantha]
MKKFTLACSLATAACLTLSAPVLAAESGTGTFFGKDAPGKWIVGAKVVNIDPNVPDTNDASGVGIVLGYEFAKSVGEGTSSFEIEYISGEEEQISLVNSVATIPAYPAGFGTYEAEIFNAYFTYRSPGTVYYKLKGGVSYVDLNVAPVSLLDRDYEDVSFAVGLGIGYRINELGVIELEYTQDSGDADVGTLGVNALLTF